MKEYKVKILDTVFDDIDSLADFIVSVRFHIEGDTVIVDKIIASKMIIN